MLNVEEDEGEGKFLDRTFVHLILLSLTNSALKTPMWQLWGWGERMLEVSLLTELNFFVFVIFFFPSLLPVMMPFPVYIISPIYFSLCRLILTRTYAYSVFGVFATSCHRQRCESDFSGQDDSLRKRTNLCCLLVLLCQLREYHFPLPNVF